MTVIIVILIVVFIVISVVRLLDRAAMEATAKAIEKENDIYE
jgi:hypothetical protein